MTLSMSGCFNSKKVVCDDLIHNFSTWRLQLSARVIKNIETYIKVFPLLLTNIIIGVRDLLQSVFTIWPIGLDAGHWDVFPDCEHTANLLSILIKFSITVSAAAAPPTARLRSELRRQPNDCVVSWTAAQKAAGYKAKSPFSPFLSLSLTLSTVIPKSPRW